jgi:hypothetical protein
VGFAPSWIGWCSEGGPESRKFLGLLSQGRHRCARLSD